ARGRARVRRRRVPGGNRRHRRGRVPVASCVARGGSRAISVHRASGGCSCCIRRPAGPRRVGGSAVAGTQGGGGRVVVGNLGSVGGSGRRDGVRESRSRIPVRTPVPGGGRVRPG